MEPMDLDSPSPRSPDLSDMEVDPNSPPPSRLYPHATTTTDGHGNGRCSTRMSSPPSVDYVNQSLFDILSLRGSELPEGTGPTNKLQQVNRSRSLPRGCQSAPPVVSTPDSVVSKQMFYPRTQSVIGEKTGSSGFYTPKSKKGYGIRDEENQDDEISFSHYPLTSVSNAKGRNHEKGLRSRLVQTSSTKSSATSRLTPSCGQDGLDGVMATQSNISRSRYPKVFKSLLLVVCLGVLSVYLIHLSKSSCDNSQFFQSQVLQVDLKTDLFGQHIASALIQKHIHRYFERFHSARNKFVELENRSSVENQRHCRPLVLSLHGWTGVGKNFGSRIVSQSFSQVVLHQLIVPLLFPHADHQELSAHQIHDWILSRVTDCSVNLFVIDEMDKASAGVQKGLLKAIHSLTDSCVSPSSVPVILILISNTHAASINQVFVERYASSAGRTSSWQRTDLTEEDFHSIFNGSSASRREWYSDFSASGAIDAFVPFLPLEKTHVTECIKRELISKHVSTEGQVIARVLKELTFSVYKNLELSTTGCKRVSDKVNYVIYNEVE